MADPKTSSEEIMDRNLPHSMAVPKVGQT